MTILQLVAILIHTICCCQILTVSGELFSFTDGHGSKFVIELTDPKTIKHAHQILAGKEKHEVHVMGKIVKTPAKYNPGFNFHLVPESIKFFQVAIEACDAATNYVEDHLDEACGAFPPGCVWCPWNSKLIEKHKKKH